MSLILMLSAFTTGVYALDITGVDVESLPDIEAKISAEPGLYDNLDPEKIKATLNGEELVTGIIKKEDSSVEWIIMIDTSISVSETHFKAQKNAVLSVYKTLRDSDTLVLYTFAEKVIRVLSGLENYEQAKKKIDAIDCKGQDTAFYTAARQLASLAKESDSAVCVPVIFSDGVETLQKGDRQKTIDALKQSPVPIYGFYPDVVKPEVKKSFNDIIKVSGGSTKSFNAKNASAQLASFNSNDTYSISFAATKEIKASKNAKLVIDMGDGNSITKEIVVPDWGGDKEKPKILSAVSDETRNIITVMYSEPVKNCLDEMIYSFTAADDFVPPKILEINKTADDTVAISVDSLEASNVRLKISGYRDASDNVGDEHEFTITVDQDLRKIIKTVGIGVGAAVVLVLVLIALISRRKKRKANMENGVVQAAYKNGKKIEQKPKKNTKIDKVKEKAKTREEKIAEQKEEKKKQKEEEKKKAEAEKFKFFFEEKYDPNNKED
ncbi:MAG: VWA domain-containing protein [Clostridia bacterium]|nr:VWA domain-containing protein [Clostridia bacterium]